MGPRLILGQLALIARFDVMFWATAHAADAIAHEMKNAVHGSRVLGAARIAGIQTRSVNALNIPASAQAATRGRTRTTAHPSAMVPGTGQCAQPVRKGSRADTRSAVAFT